jgi:hypothetical protein
MVNIKKAIEYVHKHGDEIERNRLSCVLLGMQPTTIIHQKLEEMQNPDGGFSYWTKDFSTVSDTIYVLSWLDDLQMHSGKIVDHAFDFLNSNQQEDGGWDEVAAMEKAASSTDLMPGEDETRVFLTAYCAHWSVRFDRAEPPEAKGSPLEFLKTFRKPSGLILDDYQATWDSLVLFSYQPGVDSELFKDTLDVIEKKLAPDAAKGSEIAYLLCCLRDSGLEAYHPFVNLCTDVLIQKQQENGSWESEYGEKYATDAIIQALRGLKHYNVV